MQIRHRNPDATEDLILPVIVLPNTPEEIGEAQVRANSALRLPWLFEVEAHDGVAVVCGGGPSLNDCKDELRRLSMDRATFFGLNAASGLLHRFGGIDVHYQVIVDPKEETSALVDTLAHNRLYASQVHPLTAKYADCLFHMNFAGIEDLLPPERVEQGGYTLVGGGVSVGITALCVAYTLGFRRFHLFGYDSSNRDGKTHAYEQRMNALIPNIDVTWGGRTYNASMPMKLQAEAFLQYAKALEEEGCEIIVHGDGLLPAMWREPPANEREKYQYLWAAGGYRDWSPGEETAHTFANMVAPCKVIDFGCGSGRAALRLAEYGFDVTLIDFTDNCRDKEALRLPFLQWDLTEPLPIKGDVGYCTDVMEHIPPEDVETVIANILDATPRAFFQIATVPDKFGETIGQQLHLTVQPHDWWRAKFPMVLWEEQTLTHSSFYVSKGE